MAEIAATALVAEQVVSTGLEAGAAVSIAKPTQPLQATLSQIATTTANDSSLALARSHHTITTINNKSYIFGGLHKPNTLCTTDIHAISLPLSDINKNNNNNNASQSYACYPAFPLKDTTTNTLLVPAPRHSHAAAARPPTTTLSEEQQHLVIHGGLDAHNNPLAAKEDNDNNNNNNNNNCVWLFDTNSLRWSKIAPKDPSAPHPTGPCANHLIVFPDPSDPNTLLLHGGGDNGNETWTFDLVAARWTQLPSSPSSSSSSPTTAAFIDGALYTLSHPAASNPLSTTIHTLQYHGPNAAEHLQHMWETIEISTNPLTTPNNNGGPTKARNNEGANLVPVSTGYGRHYLVYMFGRDNNTSSSSSSSSSEVWALQLSSRGFNPTAVKDVIRDKVLPNSVASSGAYTWAEVEIIPTEQVAREGGKAHPGPRAFVGASACLDGKGVVFWGGENASGEREGDGWLLKIQ